MYIRIDPSSGVPLWQQVVEQVTRQAVSGGVEPGERLPTVRELASELRINPNTVARAYQELERGGVVETRRGSGTFAAERIGAGLTNLPEQLRRITERADALAVEAAQLQISEDDLLMLVRERLRLIIGKFGSGSGSDEAKPEASRAVEVEERAS